jgi:hypothetical protein
MAFLHDVNFMNVKTINKYPNLQSCDKIVLVCPFLWSYFSRRQNLR